MLIANLKKNTYYYSLHRFGVMYAGFLTNFELHRLAGMHVVCIWLPDTCVLQGGCLMWLLRAMMYLQSRRVAARRISTCMHLFECSVVLAVYSQVQNTCEATPNSFLSNNYS